ASGLAAVLAPERPIDDALYEELEELLLAADLGATLAADFTNRAREEVMFGTVTRADQLRPLFRRFLADTLQPVAQPLDLDHRPAVVLMLGVRSEEHTSELQSRFDLVCRLLLEKKNCVISYVT